MLPALLGAQLLVDSFLKEKCYFLLIKIGIMMNAVHMIARKVNSISALVYLTGNHGTDVGKDPPA